MSDRARQQWAAAVSDYRQRQARPTPVDLRREEDEWLRAEWDRATTEPSPELELVELPAGIPRPLPPRRVVAYRRWDHEVLAVFDDVRRGAVDTAVWLARGVGWVLRYYASLAPPTQVLLAIVALFVVAFVAGRLAW